MNRDWLQRFFASPTGRKVLLVMPTQGFNLGYYLCLAPGAKTVHSGA